MTGPRSQFVVGGVVVLAGTVESICTKWSTQSVQVFETLSWARCVNRWLPSPMTVAVPPMPMRFTGAPQSTLYCHWSTVAPPSSGMSTVPAGTPFCQADDGAVVSRDAAA